MSISRLVCIVNVMFASLITAYSQQVALKTNALYWLTTTANIGVEYAVSPRFTVSVEAGYNPWRLSPEEENKKLQHWQVIPEVRWWSCESFSGHFVGLYGQYGRYNAGGVKLPVLKTLEEHRYEGTAVGGGISYGYQWILNDHWNLEASIGIGALYLDYKKFECERCGELLKENTRTYFGPTKAGVSLIYVF